LLALQLSRVIATCKTKHVLKIQLWHWIYRCTNK